MTPLYSMVLMMTLQVYCDRVPVYTSYLKYSDVALKYFI